MVASGGLLRRVAIIGAGRETVELLPVVVKDPLTKVSIIFDPDPQAFLFKLQELGYRLSPHMGISLSTDIRELISLKQSGQIDTLIDTMQDARSADIIERAGLEGLKRLSPLGVRLMWSINSPTVEKRKYAGLSYLYDMLDAGRLTARYEEMLKEILRVAIECSGAENGSIMLLDRDEGVLRVEVAKGMDEEIARRVRVRLGSAICGKVAEQARVKIISGRVESGACSHRNIYNALSVPIVSGRTVLGVINVGSGVPEHIFTPNDADFLKLIGEIAAKAIERSTEYQQMRLDAAKFSLWKELRAGIESLPLEQGLQVACRKIASLVPGLSCAIYMLDGATERFVLSASSSQHGAVPTGLRPDEGFEGWVVKNRKEVVLVDRVEEDGPKRVYVALPLLWKDKTIGVFSGQLISDRGLTRFYETFLKDVASLLAESIVQRVQNDKAQSRTRRLVDADNRGLELLDTDSMDSFVLRLAAAAAELVDAEAAVVRLDEGLKGEFKEVASFGMEDKRLRKHMVSIERMLIKETLKMKDVVLKGFEDAQSLPVKSAMSVPIGFRGNVVGVITFLNKKIADSLEEGLFDDEDVAVARRLVCYAEKAIASILERRGFICPELFSKRAAEELNRARRHNRHMALVTVHMNGNGTPAGVKRRFLKRLYAHIRGHTRNFDLCTLLADHTIGILYLDADERVFRVLKGAVEDIDAPVELKQELQYGFALYPKDGESLKELLERACEDIGLTVPLKNLQ